MRWTACPDARFRCTPYLACLTAVAAVGMALMMLGGSPAAAQAPTPPPPCGSEPPPSGDPGCEVKGEPSPGPNGTMELGIGAAISSNPTAPYPNCDAVSPQYPCVLARYPAMIAGVSVTGADEFGNSLGPFSATFVEDTPCAGQTSCSGKARYAPELAYLLVTVSYHYGQVAQDANPFRPPQTLGGIDRYHISLNPDEPCRAVASSCGLQVNDTGNGGDNNTADEHCDSATTSGDQCTLRAAIQQANAKPGHQAITFAIPGGGTPTIAPASPLPDVTGPTSILANTQPGGRVQLSGTGAGLAAKGLHLTGGGSTVNGLVIGGFDGHGVHVEGPGEDVLRNLIVGLAADGTTARGNDTGIRVNAPNVTIDGSVVSSNRVHGIDLHGDRAVVTGSLVGTTATGDAPRGNLENGIRVVGGNGGARVQIGGPAAGEGNVISGNARDGIEVVAKANQGLVVEGNVIGGDRALSAASLALGNGDHGIELHLGPGLVTNNRIGGVAAGQGNVIVNNGQNGVYLLNLEGVTVAGNAIGTDPDGVSTVPLGNDGNGVQVDDANKSTIVSNHLGTNAVDGIVVSNGDGTRIEKNLIRRSNGNGIYLYDKSRNTVVSGNTIVDSALRGILVAGGGPGPSSPGGFPPAAPGTVGNRIEGNTISGSGNLYGHPQAMAIDLAVTNDRGPTPNDPGDADTGANQLQNAPVLTVDIDGGEATVSGSLSTKPGGPYRIELYGAKTCDASGHGELEVLLGSLPVTVGATGTATFEQTLALPAGITALSATATGADGTSEPSACGTPSVAAAPGALHILTTKAAADGSVTVVFEVPGPGTVSATATATGNAAGAAKKKKRKLVVAKGSKAVRKAGRVKLKLRPKRKAKRILRSKGRITASLRATYKPKGGRAVSKKKRVTFKLRRKKRR